MKSPNAILYPAFVMFSLTLTLLISLAYQRYRAIKAGAVNFRFYRTYNEGEQTPRLHLFGRHIQNHFEVPPLFYFAVALVYVTNSVSIVAIVFAWAFVFARYVHTAIHLGTNNISHRFLAFGTSLLCLLGLWLSLAFSLVT